MYRRVPLLLTVFGAIAGSACHESMVPTAPSSVGRRQAAGSAADAGSHVRSPASCRSSARGLTPVRRPALLRFVPGVRPVTRSRPLTRPRLYRFAWTPAGVHPLQVWKRDTTSSTL